MSKMVEDEVISESELFEGDKGSSVRFEEGEEMELSISYSLDDDRRQTPHLNNYTRLTLKRSERWGGYIAKSGTTELRACSYNPLRAIAEIIDHVRETYNYTSHHYTTYSKNSEVEQMRIYQNDEVLFRIGSLDDSEDSYTVEEHSFSYDFWETLHRTEYKSSRKIEKVDNGMIGFNSIRIPVKKQMDELERDIIVNINKYLIEFYKDNNVLSEDIPLHKFISFASLYSGHPVEVSQLTLHYEED